MNVLITGCAGFIGSHAVDHFLDLGHSVVGVDCFTYAASLDNLKNALSDKNFILYETDICNTNKMIEYSSDHKIDWIINFAAETHVDNSIESCEKFIHSNIVGVKSLLECCKELGIKLFHISTDEVYGSIKSGSFIENDKLNPKNPYSATKAAAEHLVQSYENTHGVEFIIVRPSNNFGPRQNREKFIPTILTRLANKQKIPLYGDGKNVRDWLFVKDNVKAISHILENSSMNEIYNITLEDEKTNIQVVNEILKYFNLSFDQSVSYVQDRPGHDFRYSISNNKLKMLDFERGPNFTENLFETIGFYKK